jgi:glutamine cyclotransferase
LNEAKQRCSGSKVRTQSTPNTLLCSVIVTTLTLTGCASLDDYVIPSTRTPTATTENATSGSAQTQSASARPAPQPSFEVAGGGQVESTENQPVPQIPALTIATDPVDVLGRVADESATGLTMVSGWLVESTGDPGSSTRKLVDPRDGAVVTAVGIGAGRTGGDITDFGRRAVQLLDGETYALVIDPATLAEVDRLPLESPTNGICSDGAVLITSDRSDVLTIVDSSGSRIGQLDLTDPEGRLARPLTGVDRLACNDQVIVATIWASYLLVAIDRETGLVAASADLQQLVPSTISSPDELQNGLSAVAIDDTGTLIYVTGRGWDRIHVLALERP